MDLQTSKIELAKLILNIENPDLIEKIKEVIITKTGDFWLELSESEKEEIAFGIKQLNKGMRIHVDDFLRRVS